MAQELSVSIVFTYSKNTVGISKAANILVDVTSTANTGGVSSIGIADEALPFGDVLTTTPGYLILHNLDLTNYIQFSDVAITTTSPLKLKAGEWAVMRWNGVAIHAKANVAACDLEWTLLSD